MALPGYTTVSTSDVCITTDGEAGSVWGLRGKGASLEVQLRLYGDDLKWYTLEELASVPEWIAELTTR
jgi:hypothetical protein